MDIQAVISLIATLVLLVSRAAFASTIPVGPGQTQTPTPLPTATSTATPSPMPTQPHSGVGVCPTGFVVYGLNTDSGPSCVTASGETPEPTQTATPSGPTDTPTPTPLPTPQHAGVGSCTDASGTVLTLNADTAPSCITPTATQTATATQTGTPTATATATFTPLPTATLSPTPVLQGDAPIAQIGSWPNWEVQLRTQTATATQTAAPTNTPSPTLTLAWWQATPTNSPTPTESPTPEFSADAPLSQTGTWPNINYAIRTQTATATQTAAPTNTPSPSPTLAWWQATQTPSPTPTSITCNAWTIGFTIGANSYSCVASPTPTVTSTPTATATPSPTPTPFSQNFDYFFGDYGGLDLNLVNSCYFNDKSGTAIGAVLTINHWQCAVAPTLVIEDCGPVPNVCTSPTVITTFTPTTTGVFVTALASTAITQGDYICAVPTSGTCADIDWNYTLHGDLTGTSITPAPTQTSTPTPTPTQTGTATQTATATPSPVPTPPHSGVGAISINNCSTLTLNTDTGPTCPTNTATPTPTVTPTPTQTAVPTQTPVPTATPTPVACSVALFFGPVQANGQVLLRYTFPYACNFPANMTGSYATLITAATAEDDYVVKKNASGIGTINFAISGTSGAFTSFSAASFAAGDYIEVDAPATADTTAKGLYITFFGSKS